MDFDVGLVSFGDHYENSFGHESHIDIDVIGLEDVEIQAPALPEGIDRHLFVSYSSEDLERVLPIVNALEKRFNIKCVYSDRDFQAGMNITENIRISMLRSLKCLMMVTSNFKQSEWCNYEMGLAFVQSMESGSNRVIPVKLEECEMPSTLVTLTYIDGTQPFCDVPKEVIQALSSPDIDFPDQAKENTTKYKNGFFKTIKAKRNPLCFFGPAKYKFEFDQCYIEEFKRLNIQIPGHILYEAITFLNRCKAVKYFDVIRRPDKLCFGSLMLPLLLMVILTLQTDDLQYFSLYMYFAVICGCCTGTCMWVAICIYVRHSQVALNVHRKMWKEVSKRCLQHNTILFYWSEIRSRPTLYVMRYDIAKCRDHLCRLIQSNPETERENESEAKEAAFEIIERYLSEQHPRMAFDFESLPNAPSKRHSVMMGKACLCQCIEHRLPMIKKYKSKPFISMNF